MYATANLHDTYKRDYVTTASPLDLVVMLYEGCIKQLKLAKLEKEENHLDRVAACLEKAEEIILELVRSLNLSISMSNDLLELYQFMLDEIVEVSIRKDMNRLDPVIDMLSTLSGAWSEIKTKAEGSMYQSEEG